MASAFSTPSPDRRSIDLAAGIALILCAIISLIAVLHHPTLSGVHGNEETIQAVHELAGMDKLVHGSLMLIFSIQAISFYYFSQRLGFNRPGAVAGFMAYAFGTVILFIPTTLDGFITPDLFDACAASANCGVLPVAVIQLVAVTIGAFTKISLVATALATLCWSASLIGLPGWIHRAAGGIGIVCGLVPLVVFGFSVVHLQPNNLALIMLASLIWTITAGALMVHRRDA